ncbi:hypothetical protein EBZ39_09300 [bacterium]|nr:hypothetical protein [bacterium]
MDQTQRHEEIMEVDLHNYVGYFGVSTVLETLAKVCWEQPHNWEGIRESIYRLAQKAKEYEEHYSGRNEGWTI